MRAGAYRKEEIMSSKSILVLIVAVLLASQAFAQPSEY